MTKHEMYGMKLSSLVSELREISVEKLNKQLTGIAADTIEQLVKERDAAVEDMDTLCKTFACVCDVCKWDAVDSMLCEDCRKSEFNDLWEWRGVQK